ncbi:hypothetical protein BH09BAC3_BH09BAC3_08720 [soil metagenome]
MKTLQIEQMEAIEGGRWTDWVGCGAGVALVFLSVAPTGLNIAAFAFGVEAIYDYCGNLK